MNRLLIATCHALFNDHLRSWRMGVAASEHDSPRRIPFVAPRIPFPSGNRSISWWLGMRGSWSMRLRHPGIIVSMERPRPPSSGFHLREFGTTTLLNGFGVRSTDAYDASFIMAVRGNAHRVVKNRFWAPDGEFDGGDGADKVATFLEMHRKLVAAGNRVL